MFADTAEGARVGVLYRFAGGAAASLDGFIDELIVPNGIAFSPDGRVMYLSDSHPSSQKVWAFDYDTDTGTPRNRRVFIAKLPASRTDSAEVRSSERRLGRECVRACRSRWAPDRI